MAIGKQQSGPLLPVPGVRQGVMEARIRYPNRKDLVVVELAEDSSVAGVFTRNAFCAAPVQIARQHLQQGHCRYLLINTGNANAGTGQKGKEQALACCEALAIATGVQVQDILPFSTGVIGEVLPVDRIRQGIPGALKALGDNNWQAAAEGIMTTDTRPKAESVSLVCGGQTVTITGIAKGAGMIKPDMATLLAFVFTDAMIPQPRLQLLLSQVVAYSFNRITVDGDTSTNDSCMLVATGKSGVDPYQQDPVFIDEFETCLGKLFTSLAMNIIRDAEGVTRFLQIEVINGRDSAECLAVAYTIAESPLVKTALFAADPNWGRILAAVGRAGIKDLDVDIINIDLGDTRLVTRGGLDASYTEAAGQTEMSRDEVTITVDLSRGEATEKVWTSDLSPEYVRINADYRS